MLRLHDSPQQHHLGAALRICRAKVAKPSSVFQGNGTNRDVPTGPAHWVVTGPCLPETLPERREALRIEVPEASCFSRPLPQALLPFNEPEAEPGWQPWPRMVIQCCHLLAGCIPSLQLWRAAAGKGPEEQHCSQCWLREPRKSTFPARVSSQQHHKVVCREAQPGWGCGTGYVCCQACRKNKRGRRKDHLAAM